MKIFSSAVSVPSTHARTHTGIFSRKFSLHQFGYKFTSGREPLEGCPLAFSFATIVYQLIRISVQLGPLFRTPGQRLAPSPFPYSPPTFLPCLPLTLLQKIRPGARWQSSSHSAPTRSLPAQTRPEERALLSTWPLGTTRPGGRCPSSCCAQKRRSRTRRGPACWAAVLSAWPCSMGPGERGANGAGAARPAHSGGNGAGQQRPSPPTIVPWHTIVPGSAVCSGRLTSLILRGGSVRDNNGVRPSRLPCATTPRGKRCW